MKFLVRMQKIAFFLFFLFLNIVSAQQITVLDADTNTPIVNVAVFNADKSKATITDNKGNCVLDVFNLKEKIIFKHVSYDLLKKTKKQVLKQDHNVVMVMKPNQLDEVVMSISKWEQQKKDIPNKIASIDAKTISFTSPQTAADVLQKSGKVFVQKSQLGGGSPMIRGFATNRLLLSVDGVRMNNAIFRGGNVQNVISVDPYTIKNTEIIFGPGSVIYGSDAIGGVMNFYTKKPTLSTTDSLVVSGNANYRFASANLENTVHADINLGKKKWGLLTSVTYNTYQDLQMGTSGPDSYLRNTYVERINGVDELVQNNNPKKQITSGYNQINVMQKVVYKPNHNWDLSLGTYYSETSDYSRYDRLIRPSNSGEGLFYGDWHYGPQKWFMGNVQLHKKGNGIFYDGLKITTAYQFFEESRHNRNFQDVNLYSTNEKVDALSANIDFENKKIGNLRLYYGGEFIFNKVYSFGTEENIDTGELFAAATRYPHGASWKTVAAYVNGEYKVKPNVTVLSGLRYSHVWINADFDTTFYPFPFDNETLNAGALTGSAGLSWFPKKNLQITFNGSTGFRAPNIDDIGKIFDSEPGSVVVPNPDLEPEYAYNVELGIHKNIKDVVVLKGATFYTYLVDALVRRDFEFNGESEIIYNGELSNVQAIQNAARAYVYGFEFGLDAYINDNLSINSNITLTEGIEEEDDGTDSPARHVAPYFGDFHIIWKNQKLKTDLYLNYNAEISFDDLATSERSKEYIYAIDVDGNPYSPSWYTLNFRSQYAISSALKTNVSLENITNQRYRTYSSGIVAPGINLIIGVGYKF